MAIDVLAPLWIGTVIVLGICAFVASLRFFFCHSRRTGEIMSDAERLDLALNSPRAYFERAIPDGVARTRALFNRSNDKATERARRWTLRFAVAAALVAVLGLPLAYMAIGLVRRLPLTPFEWSIPLFWMVLLAVSARRRASRLTMALIAVGGIASLLGLALARGLG